MSPIKKPARVKKVVKDSKFNSPALVQMRDIAFGFKTQVAIDITLRRNELMSETVEIATINAADAKRERKAAIAAKNRVK